MEVQIDIDTEVEVVVEMVSHYTEQTSFNVENPLHIDIIPIANLVVLEVEGRPVLDPERKLVCETCEKVCDYIKLGGAILLLIGLWGGFFLFMIWFYKPSVFGIKNNENDI
jgi:hypothetical protein